MDVYYFYPNLDKKKEIMDRKLVYVGMTRASEKLIDEFFTKNNE